MNTIIIKADNKSTKALVALFEAFGVVFEVKKGKEEKSPYDPTFVKKVLKAREEDGGILLTDEYKRKLFQGL